MYRLAPTLTLLVLAGCSPLVVDYKDEEVPPIGGGGDSGLPDGTPDITVDPLVIDFGVILPGESATASFTVANGGDAVLYTDLAVSGDAFGIERDELALVAGDATAIDVTFSAGPTGAYTGAVTITSDDPDAPTVVVALIGEIADDQDGDGYAGSEDCDDDDATVNPGAVETWYDGVDQDCSGTSDYDADGDGADADTYEGADCDDTDAEVGPGASERWYDGVDQDCDGRSDNDQDGDGHDAAPYGGDDCDDTLAEVYPGHLEELGNGADDDCDGEVDEEPSAVDTDGDGYTETDGDCLEGDASIHPGAEETWYDGIDSDCAGDDDYDQDGDGVDSADWGGTDCDDTDAAVNAAAVETWYDGVDADCSGTSDYDADADGFDDAAYGGADCDDLTASTNPDAAETWYDGVDADCSGGSDYDADADGFDADGYGGADCDDADAAINPGAVETWYDGVDQDCSGGSDADQDGDGYDATAAGGDDCDDLDAGVNPGAPEAWYDGADANCDGASDFDQDGDGFDEAASGGTDCDDTDATVNPDATEVWYDGLDADCSGGSDSDQDGDGFEATASGGGDCDDVDASVSPSAAEVCDGIDQDCDGTTDDGVTSVYYADADGDGYGAGASVTACAAPSGYVASSTDCDDGAATVHPAAAETCNTTDDDCDGSVDDGLATSTYYADADGDGYGDAGSTTSSCAAPSGYVTDATDCDDAEVTTNPGADELGYDVTDNDCDDLQDEMLVADESSWTVLGEYASDGIGSGGVYVTEDLDGDGDPELIIGAPTANASLYSISLTDVGLVGFHDVDTAGLDVGVADGYFTLYGNSSDDFFGNALAVVGDVDGGGSTELVVGAYQNDVDNTDDGTVYTLDVGGETGWNLASLVASGALYGDHTNSNTGYAVAVGDFDGDGVNELATGAPGEESGKGQVYVSFVADGFATTGIDNDASQFWIKGASNSDHLGYSVALGELSGDGYDDLVACAPDDDDGGNGAGTCWIVNGNSTRDTSSSVQGSAVNAVDNSVIIGGAASDQLGKTPHSLSVGDLDDDGADDLAVGMPGYDGYETDGGAVLIYRNATLSGTETSATAGWIVRGDGALGTAVNMTGDVTNDGIVDLLAGATTAGSAAEGVVYLFAGGAATGTWTLPTSQYASWTGEAASDTFGSAISGLQDLDGDGVLDFAVSAPGNDDAVSGGGKVYVVPAYP